MLATGLNTPIDALEFNVLSYCPGTPINNGLGFVISRITEFEFIFGFLSTKPIESEIMSVTNPFIDNNSGFRWTCPPNQRKMQQQQQIYIKNILTWWQQCNKEIGLININFEELSSETLLHYFPKEKLIMETLNENFSPITTLLKDIPLRRSVFFKDVYHSHWVLNRNNVSKIFLINVVYLPSMTRLELKSETYIIDELSLLLIDKWKDRTWENFSLSEILELKNLLLELHINQSIPQNLKSSFKAYPIDQIKEWMNPIIYHSQKGK